jgi:hypothetical protein
MVETLPPYSEAPTCRSCGGTRGRSEKLPIKYCGGAPRDGRGPEDACPLGATEHLHVTCIFCSYEWGMNIAGAVDPLTAAEVARLREIIASIDAEGGVAEQPTT